VVGRVAGRLPGDAVCGIYRSEARVDPRATPSRLWRSGTRSPNRCGAVPGRSAWPAGGPCQLAFRA
jgi:hypothetical protein